jgi:hypothetical protein
MYFEAPTVTNTLAATRDQQATTPVTFAVSAWHA